MKKRPDLEVMQILNFVRTCQNMQALPGSGGLLDQDAYHVYLFDLVAQCDYEKRKLEESRAKVHAKG
jgi:hypothetical protein